MAADMAAGASCCEACAGGEAQAPHNPGRRAAAAAHGAPRLSRPAPTPPRSGKYLVRDVNALCASRGGAPREGVVQAVPGWRAGARQPRGGRSRPGAGLQEVAG